MQFEIDDANHPLMQLTSDLLTDAGRAEHNKFIIDDTENIAVAIAAGINVTHVLFYGDHAERYPEFLQSLPTSIEVFPVRPRACKKVFGVEKLARVYALADIPKQKLLSTMTGDIAVLDGLMMTGNIGAVVRSALAFEMSGIVLLNMDYHALYDRRLIRASKAYIFKLPVVCMSSADFFNDCKNNHIKIVNCSHDAEMNVDQVVKCPERLAIVLGAEKTGVSGETEQVADFHAKIPYNTAVESLNVSVAAAIIFYSRYLNK